MELRERARQLVESVADHPRRVVGSSMGVFWGAAAILLLMAYGTGFREYMREELGRYGKGLVFVHPLSSSSGFPGHRAGVRVAISRQELADAERATTEWIRALLPLQESRQRALVEAEGRVRRLDLDASDERYARFRSFEIAHGRFYDARDVERRAAVAVLGFEAAADLFGSAGAAVGRRLRIEGRSFELIGVTAPKGRQYMNVDRPDNRLLLLPVTTAQARLGFDEDALSDLLLVPRRGVPTERALAGLRRALGRAGGFHPDDADALKSYDSADLLKLVDLFYSGFMVFVGVAGTITLLIGAIGIANYQLAVLAERTVELAVARAVGARSRTLVVQTLIESGSVAAGAACLGLALGLVICRALAAVGSATHFPQPIFSATVLGVTFAASLSVAAVAAAVPALRVRHVDVSSALRASV